MICPTIDWINGHVKLIDQTKLPHKLEYLHCRDVPSLKLAIKRLSVRGAPALGVAAAFGVLLGVKTFNGKDPRHLLAHIDRICADLASARPTAVNLFAGLARMKEEAHKNQHQTVARIKALLKDKAMALYTDDQKICRQMGELGAVLIKSRQHIMTICNTGALATVDYGTALGVMYKAKEQEKRFSVYACETRPLLQGARLTAWELKRAGIEVTLICDSMAATLMKQNKVDGVFTGADRIAANGDTANKIGTYSLAVLAQYHKIPFYVVAPLSTFDMTLKDGRAIPIEERDASEVLGFAGVQTAPSNVKAFNPAFDVTDNTLITAIVTEKGIIRSPFRKNIKEAFGV